MSARYIHTNDIAALAATVGVTNAQVVTFISTHRANGNIQAVTAFIDANPGCSALEIENGALASPMDSTVVGHILTILIFVGQVQAI